MKLTREDLAMMLDGMNKNNADNIEVDVRICGYDYEFDYVDFDLRNGTKFVKTLLTLEP